MVEFSDLLQARGACVLKRVRPRFGNDQPAALTKVAGFTHLEVIVTMGIASILFAIAAPSFSDALSTNRLRSDASGLVADLRFARSEAANRGAWVVVCPSIDGGQNCSTSGRDWARGRIIFVDSDRSRNRQPSEKVLRLTGPLSKSTTVTVAGSFEPVIVFSPYGHTVQGGIPGAGGKFVLCSGELAAGRQVRIEASGRPSSLKAACS